MSQGKERRAAALSYRHRQDRAPRVVAKGRGEVAERILAVAREHGVPVHEDPDLARMLEVLDINSEIPPEMYKAVAEVLVFVYRLQKRAL
jgi:flagellar biosynthesis protein